MMHMKRAKYTLNPYNIAPNISLKKKKEYCNFKLHGVNSFKNLRVIGLGDYNVFIFLLSLQLHTLCTVNK